ncbi:MAG: hypothetical protein ACXVDD_08025, partial [Polyangia bacterium]
MNRKLGQLIKATLFALPLALPGVALAQSAGGDVPAPGSSTKSESSTSSTTDTTTLNKQDNANKGYQDSQGGSSASGMSSGTMDNTDKQNAGTPDTKGAGTSDVDRTPPAGSLGTSGSSATSDRDLGGDINKSNDDTAKMNSDSTTTTRHQKKTKK